ncbi:hypothetical protein Leryth_024340 [Lithospermum erythrorhizon]|nr:hypothetical protein Leryth_024340 [Lithospermum erythrorhizon]
MGMTSWLTLFYLTLFLSSFSFPVTHCTSQIIESKGGPQDVVWIVQLSDLHFSVHHPDRAIDFKDIVGPMLSMINPSLVLITGDLTDGKSKDLLTMKQNELEWLEYKNVMEDVVSRSGLDRRIFYDLRGNHDNFGVPFVGGSTTDFFSKYSLNAQLKRSAPVNSITIQTGKRKILFVGFDSTMSSGLRGPTNLFGHPTDSLLDEISSELAQWDSQTENLITKISFGHFPLSFSAPSSSGRTLRDTFLAHSLSTYLCGHLHTRFGKNLKRHHGPSNNQFIQLNGHYLSATPINCSASRKTVDEGFWEWEMGDWRKSRAMRILAIDRGRISFLDIDLKLGAKEPIILPTFPLDSRFASSMLEYDCVDQDPSTYESIRALVFSTSSIVKVVARVFDSRPGKLLEVLEAPMTKFGNALSRADLYAAQWHFKAFEDPSPVRFWLQIEATDEMGRTSLTDLRPFSINGIHAKLPWNWKELFVMGCQWANLYYPILWSFFLVVLSILLVPKAVLIITRRQYTYKYFKRNRSFSNFMAWVLASVYQVPLLWYFMVGYLCYLIFCPWLFGQIFTEDEGRGYMTYKGWEFKSDQEKKPEFLGFPDIMVVVLPHLLFIVLPSIAVIHALAAERDIYQEYLLFSSGKKEDDIILTNEGSGDRGDGILKLGLERRLIRHFLLLLSLLVCWKHFKNCRALMKAYDMNPVIHFPIYSLLIPLMLSYTHYKTREVYKPFNSLPIRSGRSRGSS